MKGHNSGTNVLKTIVNNLNLVSKCSDTVNVLKFEKLVSYNKILDKHGRPKSDCFFRSSLIRVFPVCLTEKHFVNFSPDNIHCI